MLRAAALLVAVALPVLAAPPPNTDLSSPMHRWYEGLRQPDEPHASCCSIADCRPVVATQDVNGYLIKIYDAWVRVPPEKVLHDVPNEAGEPVACMTYNGGVPYILCFEPGSAT